MCVLNLLITLLGMAHGLIFLLLSCFECVPVRVAVSHLTVLVFHNDQLFSWFTHNVLRQVAVFSLSGNSKTLSPRGTHGGQAKRGRSGSDVSLEM